MKLPHLTILSEAEIRAIHDASVEILAACGVRIASETMRGHLAEAGFAVEADSAIVRFTREAIEQAIGLAPGPLEVRSREGNPAFVLGDGSPRVAAGHNAVFWVDTDTGQTRPSTIADVELFARICEDLPNIDMIGIPVMPQDAPSPRETLLYAVRACVENSRKPIFFSTDSAAINRGCIELLRAAFAGDMRGQVYGIAQLSPTSPLMWEASVCEAMMDTVRAGMPLAILPEPNAGISCPYTLAGLLTISNAEWLSGLVMAQTLRPGAPILYANSWTTTDMRTGAALVGSAETSACRIAGAQMARFYGWPSHTTAPNSDNHAHDEQNAWERTLSLLCAMGAGNDLIVNCGMFATGMTCSHEQLVMDDELAAMCRRVCAGIEVTPETIAADLIQRIGPGGETYLTQEHTLTRLRSGEHFVPRLAVRGPFASWQAAGSQDTYERAREAVRQYRSAPGAPLERARRERLEGILSNFTG